MVLVSLDRLTKYVQIFPVSMLIRKTQTVSTLVNEGLDVKEVSKYINLKPLLK